jgi:hypothetical protein
MQHRNAAFSYPAETARLGDRRTLAEQLGRILARDATFAVPEPMQLS